MAAVAVSFPGALGLLDLLAVTENAIIVDNKRVALDVEGHRRGLAGIVGVLNHFMRERSISLEITKLGPNIA